ncbi:putative membrane protein [Rhizobium sp. BK456]|nr:glutamine amidotransferase [Rhizobium sp. BK456]MBB3527205.1 putative membrane protein [Rhizobium sp. BK456]
MMAGGYCSFQGIDGLAMFRGTGVEECLPIECFPGPDGLEAPEGLDPVIHEIGHSILAGVPSPIPYLLGMNRVAARGGETKTLINCRHRTGQNPLLSVRDYGAGRTLAWTTDIGPHWLSQEFMRWTGYDLLMANMIRWLAREI